MVKKSVSKKKKPKNEKHQFVIDIMTMFKNSGFTMVPTRDKQLTFLGRGAEFDNIYIYENIIIISEDTTTRTSEKIKSHLLQKHSLYEFILENLDEFIPFLSKEFPKFDESLKKEYTVDELKVIFLYFSYYPFNKKNYERFPKIKFFDYSNLQYFVHLTKITHKSSRFEIFKFLEISLSDIGSQKSGELFATYDCMLLPEAPSSYPKGYKIVTFLVEPKVLLEQGYVIRQDSWRDSDCLYQRLLIQNKIREMREYLVNERRVFINNIIATLPENTIMIDLKKDKNQKRKFVKSQPMKVQIPKELNTIGIVDGQHRVFSYYEGIDEKEIEIGKLRNKQHLLVTGIIYPKGLTTLEKINFESKLFLEINDKQKKVHPELRQNIKTIIEPFSAVAIGKSVMTKMSYNGPLAGYLERNYFDKGKLKTASLISYGIQYIVNFNNEKSLFKYWVYPDKDKIKEKDKKILEKYIDYCTTEINKILSGFQSNLDDELWTLDVKVSKVMTFQIMTSVIYCLRHIIANGKMGDVEYYRNAFKKLTIDFSASSTFNFKDHSRQALGRLIYETCFGDEDTENI